MVPKYVNSSNLKINQFSKNGIISMFSLVKPAFQILKVFDRIRISTSKILYPDPDPNPDPDPKHCFNKHIASTCVKSHIVSSASPEYCPEKR